MRLFGLLIVIFLQVSTFAQAPGEPVYLFDGKSLDGWEYYLVDPDVEISDVWSVENGLLVCKGEPMGYLSTVNEYTNFRLEVEWRWAPGKKAGNSGVLMRITGEPEALPKCVEAQLMHGSAGDLYGFHGFSLKGDADRFLTDEKPITGKLCGLRKIMDKENPEGQWNKYEILLDGDKLSVKINGAVVNQAEGLDITAGKIGLQSEGEEIHFRNIKLTPLDKDKNVNSSTGISTGSEWPQFHGPNRDNISEETGLLQSWPSLGPELIWKKTGLGHGFSSVSVANGIICTAGNKDGNTIITAMDMSGKEIWTASNGKAWEDSYPGSRGTPTIDGDRIYHQSPLGSLVCLNGSSGDIIWQKNILEEMNSKTNKWALAESLLVDGNNLISCPGGPEASMLALDKMTGNIVWKARSTGDLAGYSSPIIFEYEGVRVIANMSAKFFIGVNADNGELLWEVKHESYADENVAMPIYHEGRVFVSTLQAGSVQWKIIVKDDKFSLEEAWRTQEMDNHHGGVILLDGFLYGTSTFKNGEKWVCLDWNSGETKYITEGTGKSSMTFADGKLYTLSTKRLVGLVNPTPDAFEVISTFEIPKGGEGLSWAHPVVCGGLLYIRHGDFLFVYNVK